ncbi:MAG: hypothetical protein ACXVCY_02025 [Pseudobdellovibrionaceae bacterium]
MNRLRIVFIILMSLVITTSCGQPNVLTSYSNSTSDAAIFQNAQTKVNNGDWDTAISIITTQLSASYQARSDVKETLMYAYGGKCGISFLTLVNGMKNVSSSQMFKFALQLFAGTTVDLTACDNAYTTLASIGAASVRTTDQNIYAAILGLTRMAATLHARMDTDASGAGDGVVDTGWDSCVVTTAVNRLSDADMDRIVSGIGLIFENMTALGSVLSSGSASSAFTSALTACQTPLTVPAVGQPTDYGAPGGTTWTSLGFSTNSPTWVDLGLPADLTTALSCLNTDPAAVSDKMRRLFRRMISSSSMGFGTCDISNATFNVNTSANPPKASIAMNCCPSLVAP